MSLFVILAIPLLALAVPLALPRNRHAPGIMTVHRRGRRVGAGGARGPEGRLGQASGGRCRLGRLGRLRRLGAPGGCYRGHDRRAVLPGVHGQARRCLGRTRSYYLHFNLFLFSLLLVPMASEPILAWVAIELTALFSVLLVAFDNTHAALEAAWKYIAMMFMGAAIALLGFFILFWALQKSGGGPYHLGCPTRCGSPHAARAGRERVLVDLDRPGRKGWVGAASYVAARRAQPGPVARLRVALGRQDHGGPCRDPAVGASAPGTSGPAVAPGDGADLRGHGGLSSAASPRLQASVCFFDRGTHGHYLRRRRNGHARRATMERCFKYVTHSLTKSFCFLAAGAALLAVETREIAAVRGLIRTSPVAGAALLFGGLAIAGAPPMAVF